MFRFLTHGVASLAGLVLCSSLVAAPLTWELTIERIDAGAVVVRNLSANNSLPTSGSPKIEINVPEMTLADSGLEMGLFLMSCPGSTFQFVEKLCMDGDWSLNFAAGWPPLTGVLRGIRATGDAIEVETSGSLEELVWDASFTGTGTVSELRVNFPEQSPEALGFLRSRLEPLSWVSRGLLSGSIRSREETGSEAESTLEIGISGVDFDSPDGLYAGADVSARISVQPGADNIFEMSSELLGGELLLRDFYRDFSEESLLFTATGGWSESGMNIGKFNVTDGEALRLAGEARVPFSGELAPELVLREFHLEFPLAFERYLESSASVLGLAGLRTGGSVSWNGDWSPGSARNGKLLIEDFSVVDQAKGRFTVEGLDGQLLTGTDSRLTWDAMSFEKMNMGSGMAGLELLPEKISLTEPLIIDVMGGYLELEAFSFALPRGGEPDVQLQASINDIEMLEMSRSMGWPEFGGKLSGRIPEVRWSSGVIEIDGALEFEVFDGSVLLTDLRIERPFGVLPSMAANITATNLDLEALTGTFEFGRIGGRADGYVHDLRMLNWQPVQFDAWIGTPTDDEENHGISRQAVQHLATIGGGSATAMLSGPILRLFNNFSYRRLGLGCRLQNNVCRIRGVEDQGEAVLIMEGAGLPKISIQAFNRSVDWPQLLAELTAVSGGEEIRIGNQ